MKIKPLKILALLILASLAVSCAEMSRYHGRVLAEKVKHADYYWCDQRAEAYLADSAVVVYPLGFTAERDTIRTAGYKVFPSSIDTFRIYSLPLEQVRFIRILDKREPIDKPAFRVKDFYKELNLAAVIGMFLAIVIIYNSSI